MVFFLGYSGSNKNKESLLGKLGKSGIKGPQSVNGKIFITFYLSIKNENGFQGKKDQILQTT